MSRRRSSAIEYVNDSALTWLFAGLTLIALAAALLSGLAPVLWIGEGSAGL
jgi:hypothetical protein